MLYTSRTFEYSKLRILDVRLTDCQHKSKLVSVFALRSQFYYETSVLYFVFSLFPIAMCGKVETRVQSESTTIWKNLNIFLCVWNKKKYEISLWWQYANSEKNNNPRDFASTNANITMRDFPLSLGSMADELLNFFFFPVFGSVLNKYAVSCISFVTWKRMEKRDKSDYFSRKGSLNLFYDATVYTVYIILYVQWDGVLCEYGTFIYILYCESFFGLYFSYFVLDIHENIYFNLHYIFNFFSFIYNVSQIMSI